MDESTIKLSLILLWILLVPGPICGVAFVIGVVMRSQGERGGRIARIGTLVMALSVLAFVGWVGGTIASSTIKNVESGHVAIVYQGGGIIGMKDDGLQFIKPWQEIRTESIRVQRHTFSNVSGFSEEEPDVLASVTVAYRVEREAVLDLYRQVGPNWFDLLLEPGINHYFKATVMRYEVDEVVANGEEIEALVRDAMTADLAEFGITVEGLEIGDWNVTRR
jgi:prohibitin 2